MTNKKLWTHEESYQGLGLHTFLHRARLKKIFSLFESFDVQENGYWGDFGCSNGFILEQLHNRLFKNRNWMLFGFDYYEYLLSIGREKKIPNSEFIQIDLNKISSDWKSHFDIVTCLETIEHLGNYKNAIATIFDSCKKGGIIIISVPNEIKLPGLIKFFVRKIVRPNVYGSFFDGQSEIRYVLNLVLNRSTETFRSPNIEIWGPHLGFDWRSVINYIHDNYVKKDLCKLIEVHASFLKFNFIFVYKKNSLP